MKKHLLVVAMLIVAGSGCAVDNVLLRCGVPPHEVVFYAPGSGERTIAVIGEKRYYMVEVETWETITEIVTEMTLKKAKEGEGK